MFRVLWKFASLIISVGGLRMSMWYCHFNIVVDSLPSRLHWNIRTHCCIADKEDKVALLVDTPGQYGRVECGKPVEYILSLSTHTHVRPSVCLSVCRLMNILWPVNNVMEMSSDYSHTRAHTHTTHGLSVIISPAPHTLLAHCHYSRLFYDRTFDWFHRRVLCKLQRSFPITFTLL